MPYKVGVRGGGVITSVGVAGEQPHMPLSSQQEETLSHFLSVSGVQDTLEAQQFLQLHSWNLTVRKIQFIDYNRRLSMRICNMGFSQFKQRHVKQLHPQTQ